MVVEAIAGLAIVALLSLMFAQAVGRHHRALDRLQASEQSLHLAQQTLAALQLGASAPTPPGGARIHVRRLATTAPADLAWARVEVVDGARITELSGLVKSSALPGAQK